MQRLWTKFQCIFLRCPISDSVREKVDCRFNTKGEKANSPCMVKGVVTVRYKSFMLHHIIHE